MNDASHGAHERVGREREKRREKQQKQQREERAASLEIRIMVARRTVSTPRIRTAWLVGLLLASCAMFVSSFAAELQAVAVEEPKPGSVIVTVRSPDEAPPPAAFHLRLASNGGQTRVAAAAVSPATVSPELATLVLICIDRSGSMQHAVEPIKAALADVLATPRPDLRIGIMSFGSDITPLSPFSADPAASLRVIDGIRAEGGRDGKTKLFDAIAIAMSRLRERSGARPEAPDRDLRRP